MSGPGLLLSYRAAAELLGVGRNTTLPKLIKAGLIRPVSLMGRTLIPREQVEALARSGDGSTDSRFMGAPQLTKGKKSKRRGSISDIEL